MYELSGSQVKVEKFVTTEQRAKMEEEAAKEEERKLREKGDNARDRALDMMMGGVLEIKKEDELKKVRKSIQSNPILQSCISRNGFLHFAVQFHHPNQP